MVGLGTVVGFNVTAEARGDAAWRAAEFSALPAQFALLALALLAVTSDSATGGIVPTLQWTPRRGVLFVARAVVAVGTATSAGVLLGWRPRSPPSPPAVPSSSSRPARASPCWPRSASWWRRAPPSPWASGSSCGPPPARW
jgi:hypothetical protein